MSCPDQLGVSGLQSLAGYASDYCWDRPRRWEDRCPAAQRQVRPARNGRYDWLLQSLLGASQLRGPSGSHHRGRRRPGPPRIRGSSATSAVRTGRLPGTGSAAVTTQPSDQTASPGQLTTFSAAASGTPTPTVMWQYSHDQGVTWSNVLGNATSPTLSGIVLGTVENGWEFRAVFTNSGGSATTNPVTLHVVAPVPPTITTQPVDSNRCTPARSRPSLLRPAARPPPRSCGSTHATRESPGPTF